MAFLIRICFMFVIFWSMRVACVEARLRKYLSLISDVHQLYQTQSVCLLLPHKDAHSHEFTLSYGLTRKFSHIGVGTAVVTFDETKKLMRTYHQKATRPLVVVLLRMVEDIDEFGKNIQNDKISFPIWLLIFTDEYNKSICDYCQKPLGNYFGLRFDTEQLVLCCKDPILRDWWGKGANQTEVATFGKWTMKDHLKVVTNKILYKRRNKLDGIKLRVLVITDSYYYFEKNGKMDGFFVAIARELQRVMNFEIVQISKKNNDYKSIHNLIMSVSEGEGDLCVMTFAMIPRTYSIADYTLPLVESKIELIVKEIDGSEVKWSAYFEVFTFPLWMMTIFLHIGSTTLLAIIEMWKGEGSFTHGFFINLLNITGIFCGQSPTNFPTDTPRRIMLYSITIAAMAISIAYSAMSTSFAAVSTPKFPFSTVEGFVNHGLYKAIVLQNHINSSMLYEVAISKVKPLMKPKHLLPLTLAEAISQVCSEKVGLFAFTAELYSRHEADLSCNLHRIDLGFYMKVAMVMPLGSQYTGVINYYIQLFQENGMINRLKKIYAPVSPQLESTSKAITLKGVIPVLLILACGVALALLGLLCEKICARQQALRLKKQRQNVILNLTNLPGRSHHRKQHR